MAEATLSIIAAGVLASFKTASKNGRGIKPVPLLLHAPVSARRLMLRLPRRRNSVFLLLIPAASLTEPPIDGTSTRRASVERFSIGND